MSDVNEKKLANTKGGCDSLLPFQLEKSVVRGRMIRLSGALDSIFARHKYPQAVAVLLSKATAMAAALGSALKFDGVFTLQTKTDGPVSRLVVDVTSDGSIRACATYQEGKISDLTDVELLGKGHLVFTVDQKNNSERYQGVVNLDGEGLTEAFQLYFKQSEQIPTGLISEARVDENGHWHSACLMLQRMPRYGGEEVEAPIDDTAMEDDWFRVMSLMQTCTTAEITDPNLPAEDLLYRLFHEEDVRVYDRSYFREECRCSHEKLEAVLKGMPKEDIKDVVDEQGKITVTCEFCSEVYNFLPDDFLSVDG